MRNFLRMVCLSVLIMAPQGSQAFTRCDDKIILGRIEKTLLPQQQIILEAKLDTGADVSSLSAKHIELIRQTHSTVVRFLLDQKKGPAILVTTPLIGMARVQRRKDEHVQEKPVQVEQVQVKQAQEKPVQVEQVQVKQAQEKPVQVEQVQVKQAQEKPVQVEQAQVKQAQIERGEGRLLQSQQVRNKLAQGRPMQTGYSMRPVIHLPICIGGIKIVIAVNLIDRSDFHYPLLIGVEALKKLHALVDVSQKHLVDINTCT